MIRREGDAANIRGQRAGRFRMPQGTIALVAVAILAFAFFLFLDRMQAPPPESSQPSFPEKGVPDSREQTQSSRAPDPVATAGAPPRESSSLGSTQETIKRFAPNELFRVGELMFNVDTVSVLTGMRGRQSGALVALQFQVRSFRGASSIIARDNVFLRDIHGNKYRSSPKATNEIQMADDIVKVGSGKALSLDSRRLQTAFIAFEVPGDAVAAGIDVLFSDPGSPGTLAVVHVPHRKMVYPPIF